MEINYFQSCFAKIAISLSNTLLKWSMGGIGKAEGTMLVSCAVCNYRMIFKCEYMLQESVFSSRLK